MLALFAVTSVRPRVFLSPDSSTGFGLIDYLELAAALILVALVPVRARLQFRVTSFVESTRWCMAVIGVLPVALRLALLPHCPVPTPSGSDDFAYILLGDTLRHLRFANPPHALPRFFEQVFVLQSPTYSSIYPPGQGMALALGWMCFGHPWAGVLLSTAAFCSACYWMLRGWTTPGWALVGGFLAVSQFGPLCYWMNCYWGGAVSATAGCLVFGALPRLRQYNRARDAALLGAGLSMQLLTRPYEFLLLLFSVFLFFTPMLFRRIEWRSMIAASAIAACALGVAAVLMLFQNKQVTGSWTTLPYALYRYQYGVPSTFTFQPNAVPHRQLNGEEELDYRAQSAIHGPGTDTLRSYVERLVFRARFYRFFFLAPLYLALFAFVLTVHRFEFVWVLVTCLVFALGTNFYAYFYPHYIAAITCLLVLVTVIGLKRLDEFRVRHFSPTRNVAAIIIVLCAAQFVFWYGVHLLGNEGLLSAIGRFETWNYINYGDAEGRIAVIKQLAQAPGKQLVFVQYGPEHAFHEWVHNAAVIDAARVVWAHDLGPLENVKLRAYYPHRTVWLVKPDADPPELTPYPSEGPIFQDVR